MSENPYVGPRAFSNGETLPARDLEVLELTNLLIAERIVLLYSPSGAGKTSLIQAGVVPLLTGKRVGRTGSTKQFRPLLLRVKTPPPAEGTPHNRYVYSATLDIFRAIAPDHDPHELASLDFPAVLSRAKEWLGNEIPVLIFDQFEEILLLDPADRRAQEEFFQELGSVLAADAIWALFSMREDYVGGLYPFRQYLPYCLQTDYRLDFLTTEQAKDAIKQPAAEQNVRFDDEATVRLLDKLRTVRVQRPGSGVVTTLAPYVLPFQLQVVCLRIWKSLESTAEEKGEALSAIGLHDIEAYGDVNEALCNYYADTVGEVVRQTADSSASEREIRDWFERQLITEQHFRSQTQTNPVSRGPHPEMVRDALEGAYLIRGDTRAGATWYELSHDNLIEPILKSNRTAREALEDRRAREAFAEKQLASRTRTGYRKIPLGPPDHGKPVHAIAFAPDGRWLATGSDDNTVRLWDPATRRIIRVLEGHNEWVRGVTFSPDGRRLATGSDDSTVRLWDPASDQPPAVIPAHGRVRGVAFSPDGHLLATGSSDRAVRLWNPATRGIIHTLQGHGDVVSHGDVVNGVAFSPDGSLLASGSSDHIVCLWAPASGQLITTLDTGARVFKVAFSPDGRLLASVGAACTVQLWDPADRKVINTLEGHTGFVNGVVFSRNGRQLATAGDDGAVRLWNPVTGQLIASLEGRTGPVLGVAFSPNTPQLVTSGNEGAVSMWDLEPISNGHLK